MDIKELSEQHPKAWDAFDQWHYDNYCHSLNTLSQIGKFKASFERYLLADLQAWLDSVGIYADANISYLNHYPFDAKVCVGKKMEKAYNDVFPTRPEALIAAVLKGLEIYETQTT